MRNEHEYHEYSEESRKKQTSLPKVGGDVCKVFANCMFV